MKMNLIKARTLRGIRDRKDSMTLLQHQIVKRRRKGPHKPRESKNSPKARSQLKLKEKK